MINHSIRTNRNGSSTHPLAIILSIFGGICLLICLGCGGLFMGVLGLGAMAGGDSEGLFSEISENVKAQVQDHPIVLREIGEIKSIKYELFDSIELDEEFDSEDYWSFD